MTLADVQHIAIIAGTVIALVALIKGLFEYIRQGKQTSAGPFLSLSEHLLTNEKFQKILGLLNKKDDSPELQNIPLEDRFALLGLFEVIAIMMNSGMIKKSIVHYMFGYYAIRCRNSKSFGHNVNFDSGYWKVFERFVCQMKEIGDSPSSGDSRLSL